MARPLVFSEELGNAICAKVAAGAYIRVAARACGVGKSTLYQWLAAAEAGDTRFAAFADALKRAEAEAECVSIAVVRSGAQGWQGSAWYLERKYPERYAGDRNKKRAEIRALKSDKGPAPVTIRLAWPDAEPDPSDGGGTPPPAA